MSTSAPPSTWQVLETATPLPEGFERAPMGGRRLVNWGIGLGLCVALMMLSSTAHAYPVDDPTTDTPARTPCHTDPSGGRRGADGVRSRAERPAASHALRRGHRLRARPTARPGFLFGLAPVVPESRCDSAATFARRTSAIRWRAPPYSNSSSRCGPTSTVTSRSAASGRPEASGTFRSVILQRR